MNLIANSYYALETDTITVQIGLNQYNAYIPNVLISRGAETTQSSLLLDVNAFGAPFNKIAYLLTRTRDQSEPITCPSHIGAYEVALLTAQKIVRFHKTSLLVNSVSQLGALLTPKTVITFDFHFDSFWELFTMKNTIRYKLRLLEAYNSYALFTHERLLNHYCERPRDAIEEILAGGKETFKNTLINLASVHLKMEPTLRVKCFDHLDIPFCELIDSEIRVFSAGLIFSGLRQMHLLAQVGEIEKLTSHWDNEHNENYEKNYDAK